MSFLAIYCAVLGLSVVILFLILRWLCSWKNYFFGAVLETWCGISLGMFMGRVKDCICERGLNISLAQMLWLLFDTFLIRWHESCSHRVWVIVSLWHVGVLPNFDLDRMDLFSSILEQILFSVIRWCAELNRLCDVAQNEAGVSVLP